MSDYWPDMPRWSLEEMQSLARSGVTKVDLMGLRGTTLVSMDEVAAMAGALAASGFLPPLSGPQPTEAVFTTRRKK